jgi:hypothetical protein
MARRAIQELEEGRGASRGSNQENRKQKSTQSRVLELALRYQLMSSQTSFVAIEERAAADKTTERAELRRVPIALTKGWGEEKWAHVTPLGGAASFGAAPPMSRMRSAVASRAGAPGGVLREIAPGSAPCPAPAKKSTGMFAKAKEFFSGTPAQEPNADRARDEGGSNLDAVLAYAPKMSEKAEVQKYDELQDLTSLQQADGHFEFFYSPRFSIESNVWRQWEVALESQTKDADPVAATLGALVLLETRFASRRVEWQMIADKAERWLAKQSIKLPAGETSLKDWAKKSLGL